MNGSFVLQRADVLLIFRSAWLIILNLWGWQVSLLRLLKRSCQYLPVNESPRSEWASVEAIFLWPSPFDVWSRFGQLEYNSQKGRLVMTKNVAILSSSSMSVNVTRDPTVQMDVRILVNYRLITLSYVQVCTHAKHARSRWALMSPVTDATEVSREGMLATAMHVSRFRTGRGESSFLREEKAGGPIDRCCYWSPTLLRQHRLA